MKSLEQMAKECEDMKAQAAARKLEQAQMTEQIDRMLKEGTSREDLSHETSQLWANKLIHAMQ
jgi:DNA-binding MarR family transcriptional regulator